MILKKLELFIVLALLFTQSVIAQNANYVVSAVLIEPSGQTTIPYVTIQTFVVNGGTTPVYSCVSDANGRFNVTVEASGEFDLVFSYIGKQTVIKRVNLKDERSVNLGSVVLKDSETALSEVNVYGNKVLVELQPDKLIYNVADDLQSSNSNLLRIAEKAPTLSVNKESGVMLNNCVPTILVNGRKLKSVNNNPVYYLKNTAASNIERIKIISNPGSKFDGDVTCGVVNIITKKNREASLMLGADVETNRAYGMFADFGAKSNKLTVNGNLSYNSSSVFDTEKYSERVNKDDFTNYKLIQSSKRKLLDNDVSKAFSLDLSYEFDTLQSISFSAGYYQNSMQDTTFQFNNMTDKSNNAVYGYQMTKRSSLKWGDYMMGANYEFLSKSKRSNLVISALKEVDFVDRMSIKLTQAVLNYSDAMLNDKLNEKQDENTLQLDFTQYFSKHNSLNVGAKTILRNNTSESDKYIVNGTADVQEKEDFKNTQQVYALYSEYAFQLSKMLNACAGMRLESTAIDGGFEDKQSADFNTQFTNLLPYVLLSTKTPKGVLYSVSYNSKIIRPNVYALNPTVYILDQQTIYYGNPTLKSEYLNTFSLDYSNRLKAIKQYVKLSYMYSNNSIQEISGIENDVFYSSYTNEGKYNELKLNVNLNTTIATFLQFKIGGSGSYVKVRNAAVSNSGFTGVVNSSASFTLPKDYYIGLSGMYRFPVVSLQGKGYNFYNCEINASKAFFKEKLNVELALLNPFWKNKKYHSTLETDKMHVVNEVYNLGRRLSLSVYYSLNDKDIKAVKASKSVENDDLKGAVKSQ